MLKFKPEMSRDLLIISTISVCFIIRDKKLITYLKDENKTNIVIERTDNDILRMTHMQLVILV